MPSRRIERLNEQLRREITGILRAEVRDPRVGAASVTGVRTAPDLSTARVFLSILGDDGEKEQTLEGLARAAPFIRTELSKRLTVRKVPELRFQLDHGLEYAQRIERLLDEALPDRHGPPPPPEPEGDGEDEAP